MSIDVKKCTTITPALEKKLAAPNPPEPTEPAALPLPDGLDPTLFTPDQLEYISDVFIDTVRRYLKRLDALLNATEPGISPTNPRIGINWMVLRKLIALDDRYTAQSWKELSKAPSQMAMYYSQRRALFAAIRQFSTRADS